MIGFFQSGVSTSKFFLDRSSQATGGFRESMP